jgi:Holliday junction resolvase RusA-like endonuclease
LIVIIRRRKKITRWNSLSKKQAKRLGLEGFQELNQMEKKEKEKALKKMVDKQLEKEQIMEIVIPNKQHPSLNKWSRWHWSKKNRIKKEWIKEIGWLCKKYNEPNLENALVEIVYYFDNKHSRDKDNYTPKFILDGLTKAGIIADDDDDNIFLNWKIKYDEENPRTVITITDRKE